MQFITRFHHLMRVIVFAEKRSIYILEKSLKLGIVPSPRQQIEDWRTKKSDILLNLIPILKSYPE